MIGLTSRNAIEQTFITEYKAVLREEGYIGADGFLHMPCESSSYIRPHRMEFERQLTLMEYDEVTRRKILNECIEMARLELAQEMDEENLAHPF